MRKCILVDACNLLNLNRFNVFHSFKKTPQKWLLVTGIANPQPLIEYLQAEGSLIKHIEYPDHHDFTIAESKSVLSTYQDLAEEKLGILITEKDYARLNSDTKEIWKNLPVFYIPISVHFIEGEELLLQNIRQAMKRRAQLFD